MNNISMFGEQGQARENAQDLEEVIEPNHQDGGVHPNHNPNAQNQNMQLSSDEVMALKQFLAEVAQANQANNQAAQGNPEQGHPQEQHVPFEAAAQEQPHPSAQGRPPENNPQQEIDYRVEEGVRAKALEGSYQNAVKHFGEETVQHAVDFCQKTGIYSFFLNTHDPVGVSVQHVQEQSILDQTGRTGEEFKGFLNKLYEAAYEKSHKDALAKAYNDAEKMLNERQEQKVEVQQQPIPTIVNAQSAAPMESSESVGQFVQKMFDK